MRILILGATGMLGNCLYRYFSKLGSIEVFGTVRENKHRKYFCDKITENIIHGCDASNFDTISDAINKVKPDLIVNCIGIIKQRYTNRKLADAIRINSLFPHQLAVYLKDFESRLIHISTDCVFSGSKGNYVESDLTDAVDVYGRTKYLGEIDLENTVTLRTSLIGHEILGSSSLVNWFLGQSDEVSGFTRAIFSGLPAVEMGLIIHNYILPNPSLSGLYHVAAKPISKYDLLCLIKKYYRKKIKIIPDGKLVIDRSLNASKFTDQTGYKSPDWESLVAKMEQFR
jgi:dTDP-4-dehydrorhamnose reductase